MVSYPCCFSTRATPLSIAGSSSTTKTSSRLDKNNIPDMFATPLTGALIAANNNRASLAFLYEWIARYAYHTDERAACRSAPNSYFASPIKPVTSAHLSQDDPPRPTAVRGENQKQNVVVGVHPIGHRLQGHGQTFNCCTSRQRCVRAAALGSTSQCWPSRNKTTCITTVFYALRE